jgi:cell wall-associated NlpC family hydrolase
MTPLIQSDDDVSRLCAIAESWIGTPYAPDGVVKGYGCSCQNLPSYILSEYGSKAPSAPPRGCLMKNEILGVTEQWLDNHPEYFSRVATADEIKPGDVILISAGYGHLALAIDCGELIHVWQRTPAHRTTYKDQLTLSRIKGIWRPLA